MMGVPGSSSASLMEQFVMALSAVVDLTLSAESAVSIAVFAAQTANTKLFFSIKRLLSSSESLWKL